MYIEKQKSLFECQFSFRKGHSTAHVIAEITDSLKKAIDEKFIHLWRFSRFIESF